MSPTSDSDLLDDWRAGNSAAGNELIGRHFSAVYRFFRRRTDGPDTAQDLSQSTFVACLEANSRLRDGHRFRAYLLGIARNVLLRHWRAAGEARQRHRRLVDPPSGTSPSRVVAMREEQRLLLRALRALPLELQLTVELHYWEQLTTHEVAEILEVKPGTIKWRLSRAREQLRQHISESAASATLVESTVRNLDGWARSLSALLGRDSDS